MGEDMAAALRLLQAGHTRVYEPEACAIHSHNYTLKQEFKRYFDIGTLMSLDAELHRIQLTTTGEGFRFLRYELAAAWRAQKFLGAANVATRTVAKYAGFSLGQRYRVFPLRWRSAMSMHSYYWR